MAIRRSVMLVVGSLVIASCSSGDSPKAAPSKAPGTLGRLVFSIRDFSDPSTPGHVELYSVNADGSSPTKLTDTPDDNELSPVWSPDGKRIAYVRGYESSEIFTMNADGTAGRRLRDAPGADDGPAWSPDGSKIAFSGTGLPLRGGCSGVTCVAELFVINADGSSPAKLTTAADGAASAPAWSPDGALIAFSGGREGDIYVIEANGRGLRRLTRGAAFDGSPRWSPDGRRIVFHRSFEYCPACPGPEGLFIVMADGTGETHLAGPPTSAPGEKDFAFSPDGRRVAFSRPGVQTVDVESGRLTPLIGTTGNVDYVVGAWSPIGDAIAFSSNRDDASSCSPCRYYAYVMRSDGSGVRRINTPPDEQSFPISWTA